MTAFGIGRDRPRLCPACGAKLDGYGSFGDENHRPGPGDCTVCSYCRALLVFTEDALREPTDEELKEALQNPDVLAIIRSVDEMHRRYGPNWMSS